LYRADTIVACATPAGRGAIAVVRISGCGALEVAAKVFRPATDRSWEPWRMRLGTVRASDGVTPVDQALGVFFPANCSFTGEDTFEIHSHGSPVVVEEVVSSALAAGARTAERGEFTRRAVLNGKIDLLQAEAIADLVDARVAGAARLAWQQLQGSLSGQLSSIREKLLTVLVELEARIDFTDDELPEEDFRRRASCIEEVDLELTGLLNGYAAARRQRDGVRVVFTGRPNAGKSSLVNRLLGNSRMIVSDEPGTTRDAVEETVDLGGTAFVFTDTAGIRDDTGPAETQAVERARERVRDADLRVLVVDASLPACPQDEALWGEVRGAATIVVLNKADLGIRIPSERLEYLRRESAATIWTSARTGAGCEELVGELAQIAQRMQHGELSGISRARHRIALERSLEPLRRAKRLAMSEDACELAVVELRDAMAELASIGEALGDEEVLDRIFSEFCIGK
jgi:tRNA modification GTPase